MGCDLTVNDFTRAIREKLQEDDVMGFNVLSREQQRSCLEIVQGVSINANKDSRAGEIIIYATPKFRMKRPRSVMISL